MRPSRPRCPYESSHVHSPVRYCAPRLRVPQTDERLACAAHVEGKPLAGMSAYSTSDQRLAFFDNVGGELRRVALPTFFAEWIVPAGMNSASPALSVTGGLPSTRYSGRPSMT